MKTIKQLVNLTRESHFNKNMWITPDIDEEIEEIQRTSKSLRIPLRKLIKAFFDGSMTVLSEEIWSKIKNTDSYNTHDEKLARTYANEYEKDIDSIYFALDEGTNLPMPIVLKTGKIYYLIAGNTRLMAARSRGIRPFVFLISIN
jgi:hypothetical protein